MLMQAEGANLMKDCSRKIFGRAFSKHKQSTINDLTKDNMQTLPGMMPIATYSHGFVIGMLSICSNVPVSVWHAGFRTASADI